MKTEPMSCVTLLLPFPPSVNCLYTGGKKSARRFKSKRYNEWTKEAGEYVSSFKLENTGFKTIRTQVAVWYRHGAIEDKRVRDVENYSKAISDLLKDVDILEDDSLIRRTVGDWAEDLESGMTEVIITPLSKMIITLQD